MDAVLAQAAGMDVDWEELFEGTSTYVQTALPQAGARITDESKLKLYGLYKQATEGDVNTRAPSALSLDFKSRAKWCASLTFSQPPRSLLRLQCAALCIPNYIKRDACTTVVLIFNNSGERILEEFHSLFFTRHHWSVRHVTNCVESTSADYRAWIFLALRLMPVPNRLK